MKARNYGRIVNIASLSGKRVRNQPFIQEEEMKGVNLGEKL